jgi:hypothetical protein
MRGIAEGNLPRQIVLEKKVEPSGHFSRWTGFTVSGRQYKAFGEVTAWRASLWDEDELLGVVRGAESALHFLGGGEGLKGVAELVAVHDAHSLGAIHQGFPDEYVLHYNNKSRKCQAYIISLCRRLRNTRAH